MLQQFYFKSATLILLFGASVKGVEVYRAASYTSDIDWVFVYLFGSTYWSIGKVMLLGIGIELLAAGLLLFSRDLRFGNLAVLMICCSFLVYRFTSWFIGAPQRCPCLGHAGEWLRVSDRFVNALSTSFLVYLLAGATCFFYLSWRQRGISAVPTTQSP